MNDKVKRPRVDWDAMEPHYRCNIKSLKELGQEFGCSDAAIVKHARNAGWARDLNAKVNALADAKVSAAAVSAEVSVKKAANERTIIESNADLQYKVRMSHRSGLGKIKDVKDKLLTRVELMVDHLDDLIALMEALRKSDDESASKIGEKLKKSVDLSEIIEGLKKLAEVDEKVRKGEREAFGITDEGEKENQIDLLLRKIYKEQVVG